MPYQQMLEVCTRVTHPGGCFLAKQDKADVRFLEWLFSFCFYASVLAKTVFGGNCVAWTLAIGFRFSRGSKGSNSRV